MTLKGLKLNFNENNNRGEKDSSCNFNIELDEREVDREESIEELRLIGEFLCNYNSRREQEIKELRDKLNRADEEIKRLQR